MRKQGTSPQSITKNRACNKTAARPVRENSFRVFRHNQSVWPESFAGCGATVARLPLRRPRDNTSRWRSLGLPSIFGAVNCKFHRDAFIVAPHPLAWQVKTRRLIHSKTVQRRRFLGAGGLLEFQAHCRYKSSPTLGLGTESPARLLHHRGNTANRSANW